MENGKNRKNRKKGNINILKVVGQLRTLCIVYYTCSSVISIVLYFKTFVYVQQHQSNARGVVLTDLTLGASGGFTCEASSEAPRFKTVSGTGYLQVLDLPDSHPILRHNLEGGKTVKGAGIVGYRVGDTLDVNCTSPRSKPPAKLKWYINNEKVL